MILKKGKKTMKKKFTQKNTKFLSLSLMVALSVTLLHPATSYADDKTANTQATVTFEAGKITLTSAPVLDFDTHNISGATMEYEVIGDENRVQVSDLRGSGEGWTLTAKLSVFRHNDAENGSETLQGAFITVTNPAVTSNSTIATASPTAETFTLTSGSDSVDIIRADLTQGMGVWDSLWTRTNTKLTVLVGTAKLGDSYATIDWNLQVAP